MKTELARYSRTSWPRFFPLVLTAVNIIISGCSSGSHRTLAPLTIETSHHSSAPGNQIAVSVTSELWRRSGDSPMFESLMLFEPSGRANELMSIELRRLLLKDGKVGVYLERELTKSQYRVKIEMTGLISDAGAMENNAQLISPTLGPAWAAVSGIEALSGLSFGGDARAVTSVISFDVQLIDRKGQVVFSNPYSASFQARFSRSGGGASGSEHLTYAASTAADAIRSLAERITKDLYAELGV